MARKRSYSELKAIHVKAIQDIKEREAIARVQVGTNGETLTRNVKRNGNGKNGKKRRKNGKKQPSLVWDGFTANEVDPKKKGPGLRPEW